MRSDSAWVGVKAVADVRDAILAKARDREGRFRIHGEVLDYREVEDGWWATLLDKTRPETLDVFFRTSDRPLERGLLVAVEGKLKVNKRAGEATIGFQLLGDTCTVMHVARRHHARRSHIDQLCAALADKRKSFTTEPIERFWIICGPHSKASSDIKRRFFGHKSKARFVECSIKDAASIAQAIHETVAAAGPKDALLLTRGGGTAFELDTFNDHRVATALANATRRLPTMLAIGHANDELLIRSLVSEVCDTPAHAGRRMAQLCHTYTKPNYTAEPLSGELLRSVRRLVQRLGFQERRSSESARRISAAWAPLLFAVGALVGWLARTPLPAASANQLPTASVLSAPATSPHNQLAANARAPIERSGNDSSSNAAGAAIQPELGRRGGR